MSDIRLIGNTICPYCQRVLILLEDAQLSYEWVELDFTDKPEWFVALTPVGKVPVLVCQGQSLFESGAIIEFMNELTNQRYLPTDIARRAQVRSWGLYADRLHDEVRGYFTARTEADMQAAFQRALDRLSKLNAADPAWFINGTALTLAGAYMAPLFMLLQALAFDGYDDTAFLTPGSPVEQLSAQLLAQPAVARVNSAAYQERLLRFVLAPDTAYARKRRLAQDTHNLQGFSDASLPSQLASHLSSQPAGGHETRSADYLSRTV